MKYQVYAKKIDGTTEKWGEPVSLSTATRQISFLTFVEHSPKSKVHNYLYWYCLPIKGDE